MHLSQAAAQAPSREWVVTVPNTARFCVSVSRCDGNSTNHSLRKFEPDGHLTVDHRGRWIWCLPSREWEGPASLGRPGHPRDPNVYDAPPDHSLGDVLLTALCQTTAGRRQFEIIRRECADRTSVGAAQAPNADDYSRRTKPRHSRLVGARPIVCREQPSGAVSSDWDPLG